MFTALKTQRVLFSLRGGEVLDTSERDQRTLNSTLFYSTILRSIYLSEMNNFFKHFAVTKSCLESCCDSCQENKEPINLDNAN